jgi:hypothetical protein
MTTAVLTYIKLVRNFLRARAGAGSPSVRRNFTSAEDANSPDLSPELSTINKNSHPGATVRAVGRNALRAPHDDAPTATSVIAITKNNRWRRKIEASLDEPRE